MLKSGGLAIYFLMVEDEYFSFLFILSPYLYLTGVSVLPPVREKFDLLSYLV